MKGRSATVQYTIRGVPKDVDRALRQKAAHRKKSLNQIIVDELKAATTGTPKARADFSDLVGKWIPDPEFDEIIESQRRINPEM